MKKTLVLCIMALLYCTISARKKDHLAIKVTEPESKSLRQHVYENDSITVVFFPEEFYCNVRIWNKLDERIYVEWSNFRWDGDPIVFGDDNHFTMNYKKEDETIIGNEYASKYLINKNLADYGILWVKKKDLRKTQTQNTNFIVPIRFSSGKIVDYRIKCQVFLEEDE